MRRGELYRVKRLSSRDPKKFRVFVIVSRQILIDSRFSMVICARVYTTYKGLSTQVAAVLILFGKPKKFAQVQRGIAFNEERSLIIGEISGKCWSTIITHRNENVRIISVRRSRKEEIDIYES